jgi:hypothetical protein
VKCVTFKGKKYETVMKPFYQSKRTPAVLKHKVHKTSACDTRLLRWICERGNETNPKE